MTRTRGGEGAMLGMIESGDSSMVRRVRTALSEILQDIIPLQAPGLDAQVTGIAYRSDSVRPGDAFFCIRGFVHDGHDFAADAVARGAGVLVTERELPGLHVTQVVVPDTRRALALASARFYRCPSEKMDVFGVTGTNGKTTTTYLIDSIMRSAGRTTGIIGTVETRVAGETIRSARTTPESLDLEELLDRMLESGVSAVAMEVSSHAIDLRRADGVHFKVAAFTNLSQDHLDYHKTIEEYFSVKKRLFTEMDVEERVVNVDDDYGAAVAEEVERCISVGTTPSAAVRAEDVVHGPGHSEFTLVTPLGEREVRLPLAGAFNVSNALVAAGCAMAAGIGLTEIAAGLESAPQVPGRMEAVDEGQPFSVFVDYAHTPDGLAKALEAVREVTPGRVIAVFGCGGDRDPEKRPMMGEVAGRLADMSVITSDNPRTEDPAAIIVRIEDGMKRSGGDYEVEVDRRSAIAKALRLARSGDAVLVAGKGHEDYQIFSDHTVHFDDCEAASEELRSLC